MNTRSRKHRVFRGTLIGIAAFGLLAVVTFIIAMRIAFNTDGDAMGTVEKSVTSQDGTTIAYEQSGHGPVLIIVSAALADRSANRRLAKHLAADFTVINYDRRGRGSSSDTQPYAPAREVDDIEALVRANGGSAYLFGSSSGAALVLDAADRLGQQIKMLYIFEPPFIVDSTHPPLSASLADDIRRQVAIGNRAEAVQLFFTKGMGIPSFGVSLMRFLMPGWSKMSGMAHTIPYDLSILAGTQSGAPLPQDRWNHISAPVKVTVGSRSESFFHNGARSLTQTVHGTQYESLPGLNHGALLMASAPLAQSITQFFARP